MTTPKYADYTEWQYDDADRVSTASYLLGPVLKLAGPLRKGMRVLDAGCGNGYYAGEFLKRGCRVVGVDLSESGVAQARRQFTQGRFEVVPVDDELLGHLGEDPFDLVISTEVIEHLMWPKKFVAAIYRALKPGGRFVVTTPYHGYLKALAIAASGKADLHYNPLWDGGHIKFWSRRTTTVLLEQAGFRNVQFAGAGRFPYLWKSLVMSGDRPA